LWGDDRTQVDIGTQAVTNCAAISTSPAHQVNRLPWQPRLQQIVPAHQVEQTTVAAKASTDSTLIHDTLKGAKTRSSYVGKREDTHKQGKS
jgi:hypothetical protein